MSHDDLVKRVQNREISQEVINQAAEIMKDSGITQGKENTPPPPKEKEDSTNERYRAKELSDGVSKAQEIVAEHGQIKPTNTPQQKEKDGMQR